jgi:hypothetical protein
MYPLIETISITNTEPPVQVDAGTEVRRITLIARVPNPDRPGTYDRIHLILTKSPNDSINSLKTDFTTANAQYKNMAFDIVYNYWTFDSGTLGSCGILGGSVVELVSRDAAKHAVEIEGFQFSYWALLPLMIGGSLLYAGLLGTFSSSIRLAYVLIGTILGVPSAIAAILGVFEAFAAWTGTGIVGEYWFSPNCCTCSRDSRRESRV